MTARANAGSTMFIPCALCGHADTELPAHYDRDYPAPLPMGARCTCDDCGATLTFVDYDYATDTGAAYTWEATQPTTPAAQSGEERK